MAISTYEELQAAVASWLTRSDLTDKIPEFISLAESRLNRVLRLRTAFEEASLATTPGSRTVDLPTGYVEALALWSAWTETRDALTLVTPQDCPITTVQGQPRYWYVDGAIWFERPADAAYPLVLRYLKSFALSDAGPTNWLLTNHPDAYLFSALVEAAPYLRDDNLLGTWTARRDAALSEIQSKEDRSRVGSLVTDLPRTRGGFDVRRGW